MTNLDSLKESRVVCPHCWHNFYADEALFISRHPDLYGDPVLGEMENRRYPAHEVGQDRGGDVLDPKGWKMTERACPRCHLQIPPPLLNSRPFFVSVVGAPRSGKTYFLTSMVHGLRKELARSFGLSLHDSDSHEVRAFLEYEKTLFGASDPSKPTFLQKTQEQGNLYNTVRLDGADVQLPKPFIFSLKPTEANPWAQKLGDRTRRSLVLYDNAGESFDFLKEKAAHVRVTQHLAECDAVLFTFDPLQVADARARLSDCSQDPQVQRLATNYQQEKILLEVVNRMRRHRGTDQARLLSPQLLVCVQKFDVWKSLLPYTAYQSNDGTNCNLFDHTSVEFVRSVGVAGLDVPEINRLSLIVRTFLEDLCPEFVALAEANFQEVRYFPVSALGTSPELDELGTPGELNANMLKVRPSKVQPFRVTHPVLWLLQKWKFIARTKQRHSQAEFYRSATAERTQNGKVRITSPYHGRTFVVDDEYTECMVIDPYGGKPIWIPQVAPLEGNEPTSPNSVPSNTPAQPPTLTLNRPAKRRGWFRT